jgi:hypothetical protein
MRRKDVKYDNISSPHKTSERTMHVKSRQHAFEEENVQEVTSSLKHRPLSPELVLGAGDDIQMEEARILDEYPCRTRKAR